MCQQAIKNWLLRPTCAELVTPVCGKVKCSSRRDCYSCIRKANAILRYYEGDESVMPEK
jgi:hypothetical protein